MTDNSPVAVRIGIECSTAVVSAFTVAPAITIVDKAIVSNASGKEKLVPCLINGVKDFLFRPAYFLRNPAFLMIWGVYSGTYCVANSVEAVCERSHNSPVYPKFIGSSVANVTLSVLKDKAYARMFGVGDPRPLPLKSYGLFAARDSMTILASFTLPPILGKVFAKQFDMELQTANNIAQLFTPCAMQLFSCPLHLHGLDLYNRNEATSQARWAFIKQEYIKTSAARIARIFPAYGIGGVINTYARKYGKAYCLNYY